MTPAYLHLESRPRLPSRGRAMAVMAGLGVATALISSLPSPLPDIRLTDPDVLINARGVPLHAGVAFGLMVASMMWLWVRRDWRKCALTALLILVGWIAAVNTANDVITAVQGSHLFGTAEGAKVRREIVGWLAGGLLGGAVGGGLTAFGSGVAARGIRRVEAWLPIVLVAAAAGPLLYSAALLDSVAVLFVPWQAAVAATIAYSLTAPGSGQGQRGSGRRDRGMAQ